MSSDQISKYTLNEFRNAMASKWSTGSILDAFEAEGIVSDPLFVPSRTYSDRHTLIEQFYSTLNLALESDVTRVLRVYETFLFKKFPSEITVLGHNLRYALARDGFEYRDGQIFSLVHRIPSVGWASKLAGGFDLPQLDKQIGRITDAVDTDPDLAVGTAKDLLETVCKTILLEREVGFAQSDEVIDLIKKVQQTLEILPDDIDDRVKGAGYIKRLLANLKGIVRGMSEVRNLYGSGHGRDGRSSSLKPRHAKLAVGAATTLAVFLYETHLETKEAVP